MNWKESLDIRPEMLGIAVASILMIPFLDWRAIVIGAITTTLIFLVIRIAILKGKTNGI